MLAGLSAGVGVRGLVCSPHELPLLADKDLYLVTPGIRFESDSKGDQKRVMGPGEALRAGANALVVGRPISEALDPKAAARKFLEACR